LLCVAFTIPRSPTSTLFPYTTLFRSKRRSFIPDQGIFESFGIVQNFEQGFFIYPGCLPFAVILLRQVHVYGILTNDGRIGVFVKDRKSTRLNSSHVKISYAVFCLKKK